MAKRGKANGHFCLTSFPSPSILALLFAKFFFFFTFVLLDLNNFLLKLWKTLIYWHSAILTSFQVSWPLDTLNSTHHDLPPSHCFHLFLLSFHPESSDDPVRRQVLRVTVIPLLYWTQAIHYQDLFFCLFWSCFTLLLRSLEPIDNTMSKDRTIFPKNYLNLFS